MNADWISTYGIQPETLDAMDLALENTSPASASLYDQYALNQNSLAFILNDEDLYSAHVHLPTNMMAQQVPMFQATQTCPPPAGTINADWGQRSSTSTGPDFVTVEPPNNDQNVAITEQSATTTAAVAPVPQIKGTVRSSTDFTRRQWLGPEGESATNHELYRNVISVEDGLYQLPLSDAPSEDTSVPVPRGFLDVPVVDSAMAKDVQRRVLRPRSVHRSRRHASDSGVDTSVASTNEKGAADSASKKDTKTQATRSAITRSAAASAMEKLPNLGPKAINRIHEQILRPLRAKPTLKDFEPIVLDVPRRIQSKEIICLRDLEKTLIFMAPEMTKDAVLYLHFCLTSIRCIQATVEYLSDREQARPEDRPYTNGYFIDLKDQVRKYYRQLVAAKDGPEDMDVDAADEIRLAELVRARKDGSYISMATGKPVDVTDSPIKMKRSLSQQRENEEEIMRWMARCKENDNNPKAASDSIHPLAPKSDVRLSDMVKIDFTDIEAFINELEIDELEDQRLPTDDIGQTQASPISQHESSSLMHRRDKSPTADPVNIQLLPTQSVEMNDVPFTDSGYDSIPNLNFVAQTQRVSDTEKASTWPANGIPIEDDQKTMYSSVTEAMPGLVRQSISEVCKDINAKIGRHLCDSQWTSVSKILPGLLKEFAIKLGTSTSNELNRRIMYFIHKHHREIIQQLQLICQHTDDEYPTECPKLSDNMSVHEKMSLWDMKTDERFPEIHQSELFQGVEEDDEDEILSHPELLQYNKTIFSSIAYDWLIVSLLKESTFHWDKMLPRTMIEEVRQPILSNLPKGKISKGREPMVYGVTFWLPWRPILLRVSEEYRRQRATPPAISDIVVLTSSDVDQVQATTVQKYFEQTWTRNGMDLLRAIQEVLNSVQGVNFPGDFAFVSRPNSSNIRMTIIGSTLVVHAVGSAHSTAECGEQLAWLGAALQPSSPGHIVHSTPTLTARSSPALEPHEQKLWEGMPNHKHWNIGLENHTQDEPPILRNHLEDRLAAPVIVRGFPTLCRPKDYSGIEISSTMMFSLVETAILKSDRRRLYLQGSGYTFVLIDRADGIMVWHIARSPNATYTCTRHYFSEQISQATHNLDLAKLQLYRHILHSCSSTVKASDDAFETTTACLRPVVHDSVGSLDGFSSAYTTPEKSQQNSVDSDMFSISDNSEGTPMKPAWIPRSDLVPIINAAVHHLLLDYRQAPGSKLTAYETIDFEKVVLFDGPDDNNQPNTTTRGSAFIPQPPSAASIGNYRPLRKRDRAGRDDDDDDDGCSENNGDVPLLKKPRPEDPERGSLACPFWKHDPVKHGKCFRSKLSKISFVKQHISRNHAPEFYCNRCLVVSLIRISTKHMWADPKAAFAIRQQN